MDTEGCMSSGAEVKSMSGGAEVSRKALETIGQMRPRLKMADGWFKTITRTHLYYMRLTKDFRRNVKVLAAQGSGNGIEEVQRQLTLREGGGAGGVGDASNLIRKTIIDIGGLDDDDIEMEDAPPSTADLADDRPDPMAAQRVSGSPDGGTSNAGAIKQGGWASINM
ncbi:MAG: hypothetical protein INR71_14805, partial [Terriglobus roseus]|nr:hypothetical protein [Terriglobus roseus]